VSYTLSGAPGAWTYNFRVANTIPAQYQQRVYFFGVDFNSGATLAGSPAGWAVQGGGQPWSNGSAGNGTIYEINWINNLPAAEIAPGGSLNGFLVSYNGLVAPTSINWFASSVSSTNTLPVPGTITPNVVNSGGVNQAITNPTFEGVVTAAAVPEPSTYALMMAGLVGVFAVARRRSRA
jgi:hypothetical protein